MADKRIARLQWTTTAAHRKAKCMVWRRNQKQDMVYRFDECEGAGG